jgi:hypothetical protein
MIVAQVLNKIYLTIAQSIARFGRFFCVELLRFNTCGWSEVWLRTKSIMTRIPLGVDFVECHLEVFQVSVLGMDTIVAGDIVAVIF